MLVLQLCCVSSLFLLYYLCDWPVKSRFGPPPEPPPPTPPSVLKLLMDYCAKLLFGGSPFKTLAGALGISAPVVAPVPVPIVTECILCGY